MYRPDEDEASVTKTTSEVPSTIAALNRLASRCDRSRKPKLCWAGLSRRLSPDSQGGRLKKLLERKEVRRWMSFRAIRHSRSRGFVRMSLLKQEHKPPAGLRGPQLRSD